MARPLKELLAKLGVQTKNTRLYSQALTHPSYVNEARRHVENYQRLEFMGDAVIQLIITRYIYFKYPAMNEGDLSPLRANLVRMETLASIAKEINLGSYIRLGQGEAKNQGHKRASLLSDVFEALMAACYLDLGLDKTEEILLHLFSDFINEEGMENFLDLKDPKTKLQELVQADKKRSITYRTVSTTGPSNQPEFDVEVLLDDVVLGHGHGLSKKTAEQAAAKDALSKMAKD
ncbi:MAG: ribonuclease III [Bacilli bacterium]|jgi:ribonuclease-3